jgi:hypothetical protein
MVISFAFTNCLDSERRSFGSLFLLPLAQAETDRRARNLQLGRVYALWGDNVKAKSAYDAFFTLWKDAGPGISVLKQAKADYAELQ